MTESDDRAYDYLVGLKQARDAGDVATLLAALADPLEAPRAARFLADIGATEAAPQLEELLEDPQPHIRTVSLMTLGKLRAVSAAGAVERLAKTDQDQSVRSYALVALAELLGADARPVIQTALVGDPDRRTRRAAAVALGMVGTSDDLGLLSEAASREPMRKRRRYREARRSIRRRESR